MFYGAIMFILNSSTVIIGGGGDGAAAAVQATAEAAQTAAEGTAGASLFSSPMVMIVLYAAIIGAMWFFMVRPQKKREKEMREMQESLKIGDNVVTSSGFYGKIASVGEDCFVIEFGTNKGIRIPVRKTDILGIKTPNMSAGAASEE